MFNKTCKYALTLSIALSILFPLSAVSKQSFTLPNGEVLIDPTEPYGAKAAPVAKKKAYRPKLTLNYIMSDGEKRRAMINGKKVYEGSYVSGARVKRIASNYVSLVYQGDELRVHLNKRTKIRK